MYIYEAKCPIFMENRLLLMYAKYIILDILLNCLITNILISLLYRFQHLFLWD